MTQDSSAPTPDRGPTDLINARMAARSAVALVCMASMMLLLGLQIVSSLGFALGLPIGAWTAPTALLVAGAIIAIARPPASAARTAAGWAMAALWMVSIIVAGSVYDNSWDGQHYHQELILQLADGWNPARETWRAEERGLVDGELGLWLNHYPKSAGIAGAAIYALTDRIETAKFVNILLFVLVIAYAYRLLREIGGFSRAWAGALAVALGLNPIACAQLLSFYNDGLLFSGLTLIVLAGAQFLGLREAAARDRIPPALILVGAVVFTVNLKFTGLVFSVAALGFVGFAALYLAGGRILKTLPLALLSGGALILSLALLGPSPYAQNLFTDGHIFHPLMGESSFDIITRSKPFAFREMSSVEALFASIFAAPALGVDKYEAAIPFLPPSWAEIRLFAWVDPRVGGWGSVFPEMLIIATLGVAALAALRPRDRAAQIGVYGFICVMSLALVHPEAWWARYSAFLLLAPWAAFMAAARLNANWATWLGRVGVALMLFNGGATALVAWPIAYEVSGKISAQLDEIAQGPQPARLSLGLFHSNRIKVTEHGLDVITTPRRQDLDCAAPKPFYNGHWISSYCP